MKKINASQLAFLLGIPKLDASKKIYIANGIKEEFDKKETYSIEIKKLSKHLGIDLDFYIQDIGKNYLKNSSTGSYILNYPATKLKPSKKKRFIPKNCFDSSCIKNLSARPNYQRNKRKVDKFICS